jgi:beta-1,4-N-acetylglucosaminyltransferase
MKVLLVCSTGGHFMVMQELSAFWGHHERIWVTFANAGVKKILEEEKVYWAWSPTNRDIPNLVRNLLLACRVVPKEYPDLILSTGAGVAVPFLIVGRVLGIKTAFVESVTRVEQLSLSARLVYPFLDALYVHWPQLVKLYPKAELIQ